MRFSKTVTLIDAHAEGEIGRVLTAGIIDLPGSTMVEKLCRLNAENDSFRRFVVNEPRGCAQMTTNLLLPPCDPRADVGFIPMQGDASHAMSGSNAMCVTTVVLETGILPMVEPFTDVILDTAAGLVTARATCADGKVKSVALDFFPTFCEALDHSLEVEGLGTISVDVAFGGVYYAVVPTGQIGCRIAPDQARDLVDVGTRIKRAADQQITVQHPLVADFDRIGFVMFTEEAENPGGALRNATVMPPGRIDRSPCGTGSAARLAVMRARGRCELGQRITMMSTIGTTFETSVMADTDIGGRKGILPRISGRAWIFGLHQIGRDPDDPFPEGFTMADTWGTGILHRIPTL